MCFLKILATRCRIDERKSQAFPFESISWLSAAHFMTSSEDHGRNELNDHGIEDHGRNELNDRKLTWLIKFFIIYTLVVDQKIVLLRVLKFKRVDIS